MTYYSQSNEDKILYEKYFKNYSLEFLKYSKNYNIVEFLKYSTR
jgi:hypothetical protein